MVRLDIDRLTLRLNGFSPTEGQRLARLVADRLASAELSRATGSRSVVRVAVSPPIGASSQLTAALVADAVLRQLVH